MRNLNASDFGNLTKFISFPGADEISSHENKWSQDNPRLPHFFADMFMKQIMKNTLGILTRKNMNFDKVLLYVSPMIKFT